MDWKKLFEQSWHILLANIGPLILVTLVYGVVMFVSFGILAPVTTAGYMQSLLRLRRDGRSPQVRDLFAEMSLFLPVTIYFVLAFVAMSIGFMLLIVPGFIIMGLLAFATLYLIPLMTDRRMGFVAGLKESWLMATQEPIVDHLILVIAVLVISSLGSSVLFGFLVTQPFASLLVLGAYDERLKGTAD